jgi:mannosyltransferase OCH1-like enzyme
MIPKLLHYIWVGGPLPEKQRAFIATWRECNPDYEITEWNEKNIDLTPPSVAKAYARKRWATVADLTRLSIIHHHGGIYLDTDFEMRRPLDPLLRYPCFFAFQHEHHPTDWVCNGVLGAAPGHPFIGLAWKAAFRLRQGPIGLDRPTKYGPKLITKLLRAEGLRHYDPQGVQLGDVFVCPKHWFFPYAYDEEPDESRVLPETIAIHHWEGSWKKDLPAAIRWAQQARSRLW